jgi:hypothetical protein
LMCPTEIKVAFMTCLVAASVPMPPSYLLAIVTLRIACHLDRTMTNKSRVLQSVVWATLTTDLSTLNPVVTLLEATKAPSSSSSSSPPNARLVTSAAAAAQAQAQARSASLRIGA